TVRSQHRLLGGPAPGVVRTEARHPLVYPQKSCLGGAQLVENEASVARMERRGWARKAFEAARPHRSRTIADFSVIAAHRPAARALARRRVAAALRASKIRRSATRAR